MIFSEDVHEFIDGMSVSPSSLFSVGTNLERDCLLASL